ncbi:MAG: rhomboid family intramembrane serine protease [Stackebrandtia sp.]
MTEQQSAPVCYRHPRKETYVRCVRCDRPICPDCMNQAPVGFQCPSCVSYGRKTVRQARAAFGGGLGGGSGLVTKTLVGINVGVFLLGFAFAGSGAMGGLLGGGTTWLHVYGAMVGVPAKLQFAGQVILLDGVAGGEYYRLLTSMFLHYGVVHLLFNMYVLWVIGRYLERDLGPLRYLALYLVSGLGGGVLTYLFAAGSMAAGASGCIFGLFGAMVFINRKLGRDNSGIYVLLGLNLVLTFVISNISWTGHIGGLLAGLGLGAALAYAPRQRRGLYQGAAFAAVLIVFAVVIVVRTNSLAAAYGVA